MRQSDAHRDLMASQQRALAIAEQLVALPGYLDPNVASTQAEVARLEAALIAETEVSRQCAERVSALRRRQWRLTLAVVAAGLCGFVLFVWIVVSRG
jgi:hypothetical protein